MSHHHARCRAEGCKQRVAKPHYLRVKKHSGVIFVKVCDEHYAAWRDGERFAFKPHKAPEAPS